jgi:hypothetical protein
MIFTFILTFITHRCIFLPSVRLSVSWLPSSQSPNDPMILKAFRGNRFEFLLEIFTLNSRRFYHDLPTVKASVTVDAHNLMRNVVLNLIFFLWLLTTIHRFSRTHRPSTFHWILHLRRPYLTTHLRGNAPPATNEVFRGTITDDKNVE